MKSKATLDALPRQPTRFIVHEEYLAFATLCLHNLKCYRQYRSMLHSINLIFDKLTEDNSNSLHLHNMKCLPIKSFDATLAQTDLTTFVHFGFRVLHLHNLKSLPKISLNNTLPQPHFHYICTFWFEGSTLSQPEIFIFMVNWHILRYTRTPWFLLHLQNMISVACDSYCVCMVSYI